MRKKVERLVIIAFICFVVFKILTFGQDLYEKANEMNNAYYNELETI